MTTVNLNVNGKDYSVEVDGSTRLLDLLRDSLGLTGTKEGCGEGECGACTVIMDGEIVDSCLVLAFQCEGKEIITIEGVQNGDILHPAQKAFIEKGAVQCGFCIPGMVLATKAIIDKNEEPTDDEIREGLSGNLCRCTGYNKMVEAVHRAVEINKEAK
ncbi:nicotinate dehydrogenase small FeS subunit [Andreesenia angusta]|uniref:Nicotinate dehydrogenase small FeS subunit n=1 Tax=Andreesenia angusta TaxID=39480 RepID=A0A1S1V4E5_9FIRM|nr:(2Fe-2S)-binding protein [Andreesenia angusta]OHW61324.1 nicotinate dehydrogenase small FeS subunit [Andreesenia angusta]